MADKKPRQSIVVALLGFIFFPLKIIFVYFLSCGKDVVRGVTHEVRLNYKPTDDKRWGR